MWLDDEKEAIEAYWDQKISAAEFYRGLFTASPQAFTEFVKLKFSRRELLSIDLDEWSGKGGQFIFKFKTEGIFSFNFPEIDIWVLLKHFDGLGLTINVVGDYKLHSIECEYRMSVKYMSETHLYTFRLLDDNTWTDSLIRWMATGKSFPNRLAATQAGIQKAFEIREKQLNAAKHENPAHAD